MDFGQTATGNSPKSALRPAWGQPENPKSSPEGWLTARMYGPVEPGPAEIRPGRPIYGPEAPKSALSVEPEGGVSRYKGGMVQPSGRTLPEAGNPALGPCKNTLCYAIVFPGRKSSFRAGFRPDCYLEKNEIGSPAGLRPEG